MDKTYHLVINPTLECNFKCWYCYEKHPQGVMTEQTIEKIRKHILYMVEKEKIFALHLSWFGGEPLLYFDKIIYPISMFARDICAKYEIPCLIGVTTNAYKINADMILKMKEIGLNSFQITIDGDRERHDKIRNENGMPSFDRIMNNIFSVLDSLENVRITLRVNYDEQTLKRSDFSKVLNVFPEKHRKRVTVDLQRVWQVAKKTEGDNIERVKLYDYCSHLGFAQNGIGSNIFRIGASRKCYADKYWHAEINYDGKIYRCTAKGYDDKYVMGTFGDDGIIHWNNREMARRYSKAPFENAQCLNCKYLPLCLGPCSQRAVDYACSSQKMPLCDIDKLEISPETIIVDYYKRKMQALAENRI